MNLYISDLHFGHKNVIGFDHRPFIDTDEMDHCLIKLWNTRVQPDDHVYVVGDFASLLEKAALFCYFYICLIHPSKPEKKPDAANLRAFFLDNFFGGFELKKPKDGRQQEINVL